MTSDTVQKLAALIRENTSSLPTDIEDALRRSLENSSVPSERSILSSLLDNAALARASGTPMCQDTGTLTFFFEVPVGTDTGALRTAVEQAAALATENGWLRRNTIETLSGKSIDSNAVSGQTPVCHFRTTNASRVKVALLQKGGGSENMSRQFSLPDASLGAGRDLEGVRRCILRAVWEAQGFGCAPGILGVCIGGDRATGYEVAKEQLLRRLDDASPDVSLATLESRCLSEANSLGIGPMGLGGKTTLLGVKIAARPRLPASYFVTIAYCCWACRRHSIVL